MTITLELPPEAGANLIAQAKARGLSLDACLTTVIATQAGEAPQRRVISAQEVNRLLDEAADMIPEGIPPLPEKTMSRESLYTREDEW